MRTGRNTFKSGVTYKVIKVQTYDVVHHLEVINKVATFHGIVCHVCNVDISKPVVC